MARRKRNNRRRRRSFAGLYRLVCLVLIVGTIAGALAVFFKVETVAITGQSRYTAAEVESHSGVRPGDNLFFMNKYDVAAAISAALPYVESVNIRRDLPSTLAIHINECTCGVSLVQDGQAWSLCSSGKIVDALATSPTGSAVVTGLTLTAPQVGQGAAADEENAPLLAQLKEILAQLRQKGMLHDVQAIRLEDPACITLRYLDRFDVELPWGADFDYKLNFLAAVVAKLESYETGTLKMMKDGEARLIAG